MSGVLLTGALAVEIYLLLNDISLWHADAPGKAESVAPPIAELVKKQNVVRSQDPGQLLWEDTQDGQTLRRRQTLLTLDRSKAEIAFLDGTGLVLDENSLIELEKLPSDDTPGTQKIVVRLLRGTLHKHAPRKRPDLLRRIGRDAPEFEVQLASARIELEPQSELTIVATPENPAGNKVIVQSGEVKLEAPQGSVPVKQGEEVTLPAADAPILAATRTPFTLLGPRSGESIQVEDSGEIKFRFNADRLTVAGQPLLLEVSADRSFKGKVTRVRIPATEPPLQYVEAKARVARGSQPALWYWRVQTVGSKTSYTSDVEHFWAQPNVGPQLKFPADRVVARSGNAVEFSWMPFEEASGYELDIAEFKLIPLIESVTQVEGLPPGAYHWRVRAKSRDGGVSPWSETRALTVRDPASAPDQAPPPPSEMMDPEIQPAAPSPQHSSLWRRAWDLLVTPAQAEEPAKDPMWTVRLKWRPVAGIPHYRIQVGRERGFKHILTESDTDQPEFHWTYRVGMENTKGRVFYRVASISPHGTLGPYSQPKPIQIPERILRKAEARVATGRGAAETYDAIEDTGPSEPTDAAEKGDLDTLSAQSGKLAKPAESFNLLKPGASEGPGGFTGGAADEARVDARMNLRKMPDEGPVTRAPEIGKGEWPSAMPPAAPQQESVAKAPTAPPVTVEHQWRWMAGLDTGFGNQHQTTGDGTLASVSTQGVFLRQRLEAAAELTRIVRTEVRPAEGGAPAMLSEERDRWTAQLGLEGSAFHKPDGGRTTIQPDVKTLSAKLDVLRWDWGQPAGAFEPWNVALGLTLDREFRWVRLSPQVLDPQGAFGIGPALLAVRKYNGKGTLFGVVEAGAELSLPLTGLVLTSGYGMEGNLWGEWNLTSFGESWIGLRAEAEGAYLMWRSPSGTVTSSWSAFAAVTIHFDGH